MCSEWKCNKCGVIKNLSEFNKDKKAKHGHQRTCRVCSKKHQKDTYDSEKSRWRSILRKYGLTKRAWLKLFEEQGNACAICKSDDPGSSYGWHTDHCHETNTIRGILCMGCNRGIGYIGAASSLRSAALYLEKQQG